MHCMKVLNKICDIRMQEITFQWQSTLGTIVYLDLSYLRRRRRIAKIQRTSIDLQLFWPLMD